MSYTAAQGASIRGEESSASVGPKCSRCSKTVYFAEEVIACHRKWHKLCLKCGKLSSNIILSLRFYNSVAHPRRQWFLSWMSTHTLLYCFFSSCVRDFDHVPTPPILVSIFPETVLFQSVPPFLLCFTRCLSLISARVVFSPNIQSWVV